jgi:nitrilase
VIIAAVQTCPVFLDRSGTVDKARALIAEVGKNDAALAVFPEAFVPCYPLWSWYIPPGKSQLLRALYAELLANSVTIPGPDVDRLADAAREANVAVVIGVNERNVAGVHRS